MGSITGTGGGDDESLIERLVDEFAARFRRGERPDVEEFVGRHPHLADEIREILPAMARLEGALDRAEALPDPSPAAYARFRDFRIVREIGRGGMGVVYEAVQVSLGRPVALKVLTQRMLRDATQRVRFEREAKAAARLHHTNIVPIFGFGEHDGIPYYVMQLIEGAALDAVIDEVQRLEGFDTGHPTPSRRPATMSARSLISGRYPLPRDRGPDDATTPPGDPDPPSRALDFATASCPSPGEIAPPAGRASGVISSVTQPRPDQGSGSSETRRLTYWQGVARLGVQIASALDYAHRGGVLHRDVKPSNLLLDANGTAWVADFGLAKADDHQDLTATGDLLGTLRYMSPEAFEGRSDARSDVYSLGLTLYELLALRPAFDERDRNKLVRQVCHDEAARLSTIRPGVPRDLETVVHKAIEKEPSRRYPTAGELAADLQRFLDDQPIRARRASTAERVARWSRRHKAWAAVLTGAAVLLVAATVVSALAASRFRRLADANGRLAGEREQQRSEAEAARGLAERRGEELRTTLYRAEMNLAAQAAAGPGGVARVADLIGNWRGGRPDVRGWEWYHFNGLTHRAGMVLGGSGRAVASVAWSRDGTRIVSGGADGWIRIWDAGHGRELRAWTAHLGGVRAVACSPDGGRIASGGADRSLCVWDAADGRQLSARHAHDAPVDCVAWSPDATRIATGADGDETVKIWDAEPGGPATAHPGSTGQPAPIGGAPIRAWRIPSNNTYGVAWSPDGRRIVTSHSDRIVRIWDASRDAPPQQLLGHEGWGVVAVAWGPEGRRLASGGADGTVRIWGVGDGRLLRVLTGHYGPVSGLSWSPDGRRLASAGHDRTVRVWELSGESEPLLLEGHDDRVTAVAWSPDGGRIVSSGGDGTVRIWDPDSSPDPLHLRNPSGAIGALAWSPDGRRLASSSWEPVVRIWDADGGDPIHALDCGPGGGHCLAWSPDGSRLAGDRGDGHFTVWDAADGRSVLDFRWKGRVVLSLAWSPDGRRLASAGWDMAIRIWAADGSPDPMVLRGHATWVHALAWSRDGSRLASAGFDGRVRIWDPGTGRSVRLLGGHTAASRALAWSPDGRRIASGGEDSTIRIWDPETGAGVAVLRGHTGHVRSISWSGDGSRLASGGEDRVVRLWDTAAWREILALRGHADSIFAVAWDPEGRRLASAGDDRVVVIRDATPGYLADRSDRLRTFPKTPAGHRLRAEVLAHRGDGNAAAAEFRLAMAGAGGGDGRTFLAGWWAAGPFDDPGHEPRPEDGLDLDSRVSPWEPVEATADGRVDLDRYLPPGHAGAAYAWLRVWSAGPAPVRLRIGASGRFRAWIDDRPILDAIPADGACGTEEATVTLPAGWSSLAVRVEAGGDRPALRAWIEHEADLARDRIDLLLVRGRWSEAGAEIDEQARSRPGTAAGHLDRAIRAARSRASWLRGRANVADADAAERMAALWSDRLKSIPADHDGSVPGHRRGRRRNLSSAPTFTGDSDGTIYTVDAAGNLLWYRELARDGTTKLAPNDGVVIGTGWEIFNRVIDGGDGVLYAIDRDGNLRWYKDTHRDGTLMDGHVPNQGATIGIRWGSFTQVFSGGDGVLYAIDRAGNLRWYKDTHRDGTLMDGHVPNNGAVIGTGWGRFTTVISTGDGVIFGQDAVGDLWWYQDLARDGTIRWANYGVGKRVASGFCPGSFTAAFSGGVNADGDGVIHAIDRSDELRLETVREHAGAKPKPNK